MPTPDFVLTLRRTIGHDLLWMPGATAVVVRGTDVLLVRRSDNGQWTPVTGIVDPGEHPAQAAAREVLEEAGVICEVEGLVQVRVSAPVVHVNGDHAQYLDHTFRCRWLAGTPYAADEESTDAGWFALTALPSMPDHLVQRIEAAAAWDGGPTSF